MVKHREPLLAQEFPPRCAEQMFDIKFPSTAKYRGVLNVLEKCANLTCSAVSGHRGDGMLLRVPRGTSDRRSSGAAKKKVAIEHFWLCSECAETMTFGFDRDRYKKRVEVTVIPLLSARDAA